MPKVKEKSKSLRKRLTGILVGFSGNKTIKVNVERKFPHSKYGKIIKSNKNYLVHVEKESDELKKGDVVLFEECAPISKRKTWKLVRVVK